MHNSYDKCRVDMIFLRYIANQLDEIMIVTSIILQRECVLKQRLSVIWCPFIYKTILIQHF